MAKKLNKNRMLTSRVAVFMSLAVVLLSRQYWTEESGYHEIFEMIGVVLTGMCALGRVYSTAFLGGFKNDVLITHGIYSVLRNPLYFFTLLGVTGVALMSNHISIMIGLPLCFAFMYKGLIAREQSFLHEKFGDEYDQYVGRTRALIPAFANYTAPETLEISPRYLTKSLLDALWWLAALPIIELTELVQSQGFLPTFFLG